MTLAFCIERLQAAGLLVSSTGSTETTFDRLTADSREVRSTDGFVAICGASTDGHLFIDKAVLNGATAIVCEAGRVDDVASITRPAPAREPALIEVTDSRRAWLEISSLLHGDPGQSMTMTAVTGTNGKTIVATLIQRILNGSGRACGFIGTTGVFDGGRQYTASHTTPSPDRFHEHLAAMCHHGCSHVSIEASSHALDQHRVRVGDVDVAIFTNLSRDHLDYHGSENDYFRAKKRLFDDLSNQATALTNLDDPLGLRVVSDTPARVLHIGHKDHAPSADFTWRITDESLDGLELEIDGDRRRYQLAGAYNAFNLCAAYAAARSLGLDATTARDALAELPPVRGRFEQLMAGDGRTVIIDYAHTPDALENVLTTARASLAKGTRLWCLFGCGGDRDRGKRPQMGAIAEQYADRVIVTSDNPRSEDPKKIMDDVREGFTRPDQAVWLADRGEAIAFAAKHMAPSDALVLAGKGHETTQVLDGHTIHFDDREETRHFFGITPLDTQTD
jgi:UDP-N-acetylmuramoyl-L-alanyl-D-glutamate--2,6-diaminopimelate ligase